MTIWRWCTATLLVLWSVGTSAASAAAPDPGIADAVAATRAAIGEHRLVLLGEYHGTREIPQYTAALVDALSADGSVALALEMSRSEQPALDRFMTSDGGAAAVATLQATQWWSIKGQQHDLRRSRDMFELILRLRELRAAGREISVWAIDVAAGVHLSSDQRDRDMAAALRERHRASDAARVLVLIGNVHAMLAKPTRAPPQMQQPMGSYLGDLDPFSIRLSALKGEFWGCMGECKAIAIQPTGTISSPWRGPEYHYFLVLPQLSVARFMDGAE